jgi:hypothetical protein
MLTQLCCWRVGYLRAHSAIDMLPENLGYLLLDIMLFFNKLQVSIELFIYCNQLLLTYN